MAFTPRVLVFLIFTTAALAGCGDKIEPGHRAAGIPVTVKARVDEALVSNQVFVYEAVGTVQAGTTSTLSSKLMGTVDRITVKEGDRVKKGDTLVVIDDRQVAAQLQQAEAALSEARRGMDAAISARDAAQANADLALSTYRRYQRLLEEESASQQEFDEVKARYEKAESNLQQSQAMVDAAGYRIQQAKAALTSAQVHRRDVVVRAPYDGVVTAKLVDVGDLASPGTPFLRLEMSGLFEVRLILPEVYIEEIREGQAVDVRVPAIEGLVLKGKIDTIAPSADQQTRSFQVKVLLEQTRQIRSGMFARVDIPVGEAGGLLVPSSAVVEIGQLTGLFIVDDEERARFRLVRTGRTIEERVEVISGLKAGQRFVVAPPPEMVDGAAVEVTS
jgi:RND family efflux transporter MFP subunit